MIRVYFPKFAAILMPAFIVLLAVASSQDKPAANAAPPEKSAQSALPPDSITQTSVEASGQRIDYTAVAEIISVGATDEEDAQLGPDGKPMPGTELALAPPKNPADAPPVAHMFCVAYFKTGANPETRPVTFFYNGGPGSSTMWLHLGSLGAQVCRNRGRHAFARCSL